MSHLLNKHSMSNHLHFCVYQTPETVLFMPTATLLGEFWAAMINSVLSDFTIATGCGLDSALSSTAARSWLVLPQCPFRGLTTLSAVAHLCAHQIVHQTTQSCSSPPPLSLSWGSSGDPRVSLCFVTLPLRASVGSLMHPFPWHPVMAECFPSVLSLATLH